MFRRVSALPVAGRPVLAERAVDSGVRELRVEQRLPATPRVYIIMRVHRTKNSYDSEGDPGISARAPFNGVFYNPRAIQWCFI